MVSFTSLDDGFESSSPDCSTFRVQVLDHIDGLDFELFDLVENVFDIEKGSLMGDLNSDEASLMELRIHFAHLYTF